MVENGKRVIVDAVEFGELVQFPKVLRAAVSAMQPARLVIALLAVLAAALLRFPRGGQQEVQCDE